MDLIQVEGLSDLLRAETEAQRKYLLIPRWCYFKKSWSMEGQKLLSILAFLEAELILMIKI